MHGLQFESGFLLDKQSMDLMLSAYLDDPRGQATDPLVSVARASSHRDLPAAFILTASHDPLRDEGADYARILQAAGVAVEYKEYPGMLHGFLSHTGNPLLPPSNIFTH